MTNSPAEPLLVDFVGELYSVEPGTRFSIGREGDLVLDDDNLFLHRTFLILEHDTGLWWVANVGSHIGATLTEKSGTSRSWIAPGARVPLVFPEMAIVFTAGSTTYEILLTVPLPGYETAQPRSMTPLTGETTVGMVTLTPSQHLAILALAEPWLRRTGSGPVDLPRNADAAARLGWTLTRFSRKLDNVCDKLDRIGVKGMRGGPRAHASYRRTALVDYALTARIVTVEDLPLLDSTTQPAGTEHPAPVLPLRARHGAEARR